MSFSIESYKSSSFLKMRGLSYTDGNRLFLNGCDLTEICQKLGTPVWVLAGETLSQRAKNFSEMIREISPGATCHFAMKSLDHLAVLTLLRQTSMGLDIVSGGELSRALKAGFKGGQIVFSGVGKTDAELEYALKANIGQINVESIGELERLSAIAEQNNLLAPVALRINPHFAYGGHAKITTGNKSDKFGIPWPEISTLWHRVLAEMPAVKLQGIAVHGGSQILDVEKFRSFYQHISKIIRQWQLEGLIIESLDCGGGFGIPYHFGEKPLSLEKISQVISETLIPLKVKLRFEPGRYISGSSGVLLSRVTEIKKTEGHNFLLLDSGMNDLMRPALYGASHEVLPLNLDENAPLETYDIAGPICESSDFFNKGKTIPKLKRGDLVAFLDCGAYGSVMSTTYNSHPLAPIVLAAKGKWDVIRKRQTIEEILSQETTPQWLT